VAVLGPDGALTVWLDRFADNTPVDWRGDPHPRRAGGRGPSARGSASSSRATPSSPSQESATSSSPSPPATTWTC
jgi:hypothetical protein